MASAVAITGCGWVSPAGIGASSDLVDAWQRGKASAVSPSARSGGGDAAVLDAETARLLGPHGGPGTRLSGLALAAARAALAEAGCAVPPASPERIGVFLGSQNAGLGGMVGFGQQILHAGARFVSPLLFPETVGNFAAATVARLLGLEGPNQTVCCGRGSGVAALIEAMRVVQAEWADAMLAGGAENLIEELDIGPDGQAAGATAPTAVRRAEGACLFVLEPIEGAMRRGARPLALVREAAAPKYAGEPPALCIRDNDAPCDDAAVSPELPWGRTGAAGAAFGVALGLGALLGRGVPRRTGSGDVMIEPLPAPVKAVQVVSGDGARQVFSVTLTRPTDG